MVLLKKKYLFSPTDEFKHLDLSDFYSIIDAFERRIIGWFFEPIELLEKEKNKNLFAITAIECMLTDSLRGFWSGKDSTGEDFKDFLVTCIKIRPEIARLFYKRFRNGILHQTNIKKKSVISENVGDFLLDKSGVLFFNPLGFHYLLRKYFEEYLKKLRSRTNDVENFKKRFETLFKNEFSTDEWEKWKNSGKTSNKK